MEWARRSAGTRAPFFRNLQIILGVKNQIKFSIKISTEDELDIDEMTIEELEAYIAELEAKRAALETIEPDEDSDEYEEWEDRYAEVEEQIDEAEERLEELQN